VIHSFGRLAALLPVLPRRTLPKIQTYQRDAVPWAGVGRAVRLAGPSIVFTGCSTSVYRREPTDVRHGEANAEWKTVFNGVDTDRYIAVRHVDSEAPLIFLGRIERIKGTHNAIAIARRAGRRLIIAGVHDTSGVHADYFTREIQPHVDGSQVCYVGPVDDEAKNRWLGESAALLMPIEWEEPFGIVMAEALACGTPVIGFPRGSVPEVVRDGVNGYIRDSVESAAAAVRTLDRLDRRIIRADCETRFSGRAIVDQYERIYTEMRSRLVSRLRADAPVAVR
jgi:glycosyltransferase involved in cell wall biosynthesis